MTSSSPNVPANNWVTVAQYPTEVAINVPTVISGSADFSKVAQITVVAEDRFSLPVSLDRTAGKWTVNLDSGFKNPGTRWLRVKGLNAQGQAVSDKVLSINVRPPAIALITKQDTVFKLSPADSSTLPANAKVTVKSGQVFNLERYGMVDGHVKVNLATELAPVGKFGYFYAPHVEVRAPISLTVLQDTVFKISPASANTLSVTQKNDVRAGATFGVESYSLVEGHVKVTLKSEIPPLGKVGYFFAPHVKVSQLGEEVSTTPPGNIPAPGASLAVLTDTFLKISTANSSDLTDNQKVQLKAGTSYAITGYAAINGHFKVTLASAIAPIGATGFVYWQHVRLTKNNKVVPFDPDMKTLIAKQATLFKLRPVDSSQLKTNERIEIKAGDVLGVDSYGITNNHFQLVLTENLNPVGNKGFVFVPHVTLKQGNRVIDVAPDRKILGVPYFSQRDNPRDPFVTCNVTSIAMVLYYYGVRSKSGGQLEDELYQWIIDRYGADARGDNTVLQQLYRSYGFDGGFGVTRTWAQIKNEIAENRPVVIGGYFTHGGHIICIIGYDSTSFVVNDPYGDALTGYAETEGRSLHYPYSYMRDMCGQDGDVWAHFIVPKST